MKQTTILNPYYEWGCYLCSLVQGIQEMSGHRFDDRDMWQIYSLGVVNGALDWECTVKDPNTVLRIICEVGDVDIEVIQFCVYGFAVAQKYRSLWPNKRFTVVSGKTVNGNPHYGYGGRDGLAVVWDPYVPARDMEVLDYVIVYKVVMPT